MDIVLRFPCNSLVIECIYENNEALSRVAIDLAEI